MSSSYGVADVWEQLRIARMEWFGMRRRTLRISTLIYLLSWLMLGEGRNGQLAERIATPIEGVDAREWLRRVGESDAHWGPGYLHDLSYVESVLAEEKLETPTRTLLEELRDGLAREDALDGLWDSLAQPLTPGADALVSTEGAASAAWIEVALEVCGVASLDACALIDELLASDLPLPDLGEEVRRVLSANTLLFMYARAEALHGQPERARAALEAACCLSDRMDSMPGTLGWGALALVRGTILAGLRFGLPHLPPELDLSAIEDWIQRLEPVPSLRRALIVERAIGLHAHDHIAELVPIDSRPITWLLQLFAIRGELWFLEAHEQVPADLERPVWELEPFEPKPPLWAPVGAMLFPQSDVYRGIAADLESSRAPALVALTARREGAAAAEELPERRVAPGTFGTERVWHVPLH